MTSDEDQPQVLALAQEVVSLSTRQVSGDKVHVRTVTHHDEQVVQKELIHEGVEVTRVPMDQEITTTPVVRQEGDVTIIPVVEEILFVETRLYLKEEIHIRRTSTKETAEVPVVLRRQEAIIERTSKNEIKHENED